MQVDAVSSSLLPLLSLDHDDYVPFWLRSGNYDNYDSHVVDNDAASLVVNCDSQSYNNSHNKDTIYKDEDLHHLNNYDARGRCTKHPHVKLRRLRRKNTLSLKKKMKNSRSKEENDKWEVLMKVCPDCCMEELIKIALPTSKDEDEDDTLDTAEETEDSSRSSDGSAAAARHKSSFSERRQHEYGNGDPGTKSIRLKNFHRQEDTKKHHFKLSSTVNFIKELNRHGGKTKRRVSRKQVK